MTAVVALAPGTLAEVVEQVWASYLGGCEPAPLPTGLVDATTATVSISGAWTGHVMVRAARETVVAIAAVMLDLDAADVTAEDAVDVAGELANVVGGNVKAMLPEPSSLGLPQVTVGAEAIVLPGTAAEQVVAVTWGGAPVEVSVWSESTGVTS